MNRRISRLSYLVIAAAISSIAGHAGAAQIDAFWTGTVSNNWNTGGNWMNGVVPNNATDTFNVFIDDDNVAASSVLLNTTVTIDNLTIDANDSLSINNAQRLRINAGTIENAGTLTINSSGGNTYIHPRVGPVMLTGGGTLVLSNNSANWIYQEAGGSFINMDNTIRGAGHFGWNSAPTHFENHGTIVADQSNALLVETGASDMINTGTLRAENNATLSLQNSTIDNTDGTIEALDGSTASINAATITGGTYQTTGSGVVAINGTSTLLGTTQAIDNTGTIRVINGRTVRMTGTLNNTGMVEIASTGGNTNLHPLTSSLTLTGGGTIALSNNSANWLYQQGGGSLVNVDNTIRGSGHIGWTSSPTPIDNQGMIVADQPTTLSLEGGGAVTTTNSGTLRAENGGTLQIINAQVQNDGGVVDALDGSVVRLQSSTIINGVLQTTGSGAIESADSSAGLTDVENTGFYRVPNATRVNLRGTIENSGSIDLQSSGGNTYIFLHDAPVMLTGGGTINLSNHANNWMYQQNSGSLVNVDNTIRGSGHLGWTSAPTNITNQGTIIADQSATLSLEGGGVATAINAGTLRAENGGTLDIDTATVQNAGGIVEALDGSRVRVVTSSIDGGTLRTAGSGAIDVVGSSSILKDLHNEGLFRVPNAQRIHLRGTINNSGTIQLNSTGGNTYIHVDTDPVSLTGGGEIILSNNSNNWVYRDGTGTLVNVDNTIRGAGRLSWSSAPTNITNQGTVIADQTVQLNLDSGGGALFNNQGDIIVDGAGGLRIDGGFTTSGTVTVNATRMLTRITSPYTQTAGSTTVNGTLTATGGVQIQGGNLGGTGNVAANVTNSGFVLPGTSAGILTVTGGFTQTATGEIVIEIGGPAVGTQYDRLAVTGAANLNGSLRVEIINGFMPQIGDSFQIATFASKTGTLDYESSCLPGGLVLQFSESNTGIVARVTDGIDADTTCDCALFIEDIEAFVLALLDLDAYLAANPNCDGISAVDMNGDGFVNGLDTQFFMAAYLP